MKILVLSAALLLCSLASQAATDPLVKPDPSSQGATRIWLKIQSSNSQATRYNDRLSPAAAKSAQQRMEKSFNNDIPSKFIKDKFGE